MTGETEQAKEPGFRNVWYLGIVSLFTDISSEMILGVLPLFVTIDLGATKELLGLMEGAENHLRRDVGEEAHNAQVPDVSESWLLCLLGLGSHGLVASARKSVVYV